MNEKELRELDAWIGVNVFGKKAISKNGPRPTKGTEDDYFVTEYIYISGSLPNYTTDPAAAMLVLEKCRSVDSVHIMPPSPDHNCEIWGCASRAKGDTIALTICLFAKQLFTKP